MTIAVPPALLVPACASPPDPLARLALADWMEENGEDGSGWRWLATTDRRPHLMLDDASFTWVSVSLVGRHRRSAIAEAMHAIVPDALYEALQTASLDKPAPSREAAYEALATAWPRVSVEKRFIIAMAAKLAAERKGRLILR